MEAHGSFQSSYCTKCKKTFDLKWLKTEIFNPETNDGVPKCPECGGVVRPIRGQSPCHVITLTNPR